jgi:hypothetical protein
VASTLAAIIPRVIGFRLSEDEAGELADRASEEGISPHQLAHDLVLASLHESERRAAELRDFQKLQHQVFELREELALVAEVLLSCAGKVETRDAGRWVDQNLKPREEPGTVIQT